MPEICKTKLMKLLYLLKKQLDIQVSSQIYYQFAQIVMKKIDFQFDKQRTGYQKNI